MSHYDPYDGSKLLLSYLTNRYEDPDDKSKSAKIRWWLTVTNVGTSLLWTEHEYAVKLTRWETRDCSLGPSMGMATIRSMSQQEVKNLEGCDVTPHEIIEDMVEIIEDSLYKKRTEFIWETWENWRKRHGYEWGEGA
jgi:hypothetical protein